jgi:uracil-DNA glycosylase family 4
MATSGAQVSPILIVGKAPKQIDDIHGRQFLGRPGEELHKALKQAGIPRKVLAYQTAVRCSPPDDKIGSVKPINFCREFMYADIERLRPRAILVLGNEALQSIVKKSGITKQRRKEFTFTLQDGTEIPVMAGFHPSYVLRNRDQLGRFYDDIKAFSNMIGMSRTKFKAPEVTLDASLEQLTALFNRAIDTQKPIAVDFETNTIQPYLHTDFIVRSVAFSDGTTTLQLEIDPPEGRTKKISPRLKAVLSCLKDKRIRKVIHNARYEIHIAKLRFGIPIRSIVCDTMLLHSLIYPIEGGHDLDTVSQELLGLPKYSQSVTDIREYYSKYRPFEDTFLTPKQIRKLEASGAFQVVDRKTTGLHFKPIDKRFQWVLIPMDELGKYNGIDTWATIKSYYKLIPMLKERKKSNKKLGVTGPDPATYFRKVTMEGMFSLARMEHTGITVDQKYIAKLAKELTHEQDGIRRTLQHLPITQKLKKEKIHNLITEYRSKQRPSSSTLARKVKEAGFNPGSPPEVAKILFDPNFFGMPRPYNKGEEDKQASTDKDILDELLEDDPPDDVKHFIEHMLSYRTTDKSRGTYTVGLQKLVCHDGNIHANFNQDRARTGRLSSSKPNMQNIIRGPKFRSIFIAPPGMSMTVADYSQVELRILAAQSQDPTMMEIFNSGKDMHAATAAEVFSVDLENVTTDMRFQAKSVNFGVVYGQGPWGLAQNTGMSQDDAEEFINIYFETFPGVEAWQDETKVFVSRHGFVYTMLGRRRNLENARIQARNKEERSLLREAFRQAINHPIQGSAADICLVSLIDMTKQIIKQKLPIKLVNTVHDSIMAVHKTEDTKDVVEFMNGIMVDTPMRWLGDQMHDVPIIVDFKTGQSWGATEE